MTPVSEIDPLTLQSWLEWAGARLIALPVDRIKPSGPRVCWPDYSTELFQVLQFRRASGLRTLAPARDEIPIMDLILQFPNVCEKPHSRRVLHARALVHPLGNRHLYPWKRIAELLHSDPRTVRRFHELALREAATKADSLKVQTIRAFLAEAA